MTGGWVKFHRKLLSSSIWRDQDMFRLWCWCLLKASYCWTTEYVRGTTVDLKPGQFVFSLRTACKETGLSEQKFKRCIKALQSGRVPAIVVNPTHSCSIATIVKWKDYQESDSDGNTQPTQLQHTSNTVVEANRVAVPPPSPRARAPARKEEEEEKKPHTYTNFEIAISPTYRRVLEIYREISGIRSRDANTKEGARIIAAAVDNGDLDIDQVPAIIQNGLADKTLPNQRLRGIANNFNAYLPAAGGGASTTLVVRLVCDACGEEQHVRCSRDVALRGAMRQRCPADGCDGIQRMEEGA